MTVEKPNILLIQCDQTMARMFSFYGGEHCRTPYLDALAAESVIFDQAYTVCPVCTPARASLQNGAYPFTHGMEKNAYNLGCTVHELRQSDNLLSRHLISAGYQPGFTGKWHLGHGKDKTASPECNWPFVRKQMESMMPEEYLRMGTLPTDIGYIGDDFPGHGNGGVIYKQFHDWLAANGRSFETERGMSKPDETYAEVTSGVESTNEYFLVERAKEIIGTMAEQSAPWCFQLHFWGPHTPYYPTTEYLDMYRTLELPPWESFTDKLVNKPHIHNITRHRDNWTSFQEGLRYYYSFMSMIDGQIGRLLDWLKEQNLYDTTMILFTSDHGDTQGVHNGLLNKGFNMYEETVRIPLIIRPAGGTEQQRSDVFVNHCDLYTTLLHSAGLDPDEIPGPGRSLIPVLTGKEHSDWPDTLVAQAHGFGAITCFIRMLRHKEWKYVWNLGDMEELYNLAEDPYEINNRAVDPAYNEILMDMRNRLHDWMKNHGDPAAGRFLNCAGKQNRISKPYKWNPLL